MRVPGRREQSFAGPRIVNRRSRWDAIVYAVRSVSVWLLQHPCCGLWSFQFLPISLKRILLSRRVHRSCEIDVNLFVERLAVRIGTSSKESFEDVQWLKIGIPIEPREIRLERGRRVGLAREKIAGRAIALCAPGEPLASIAIIFPVNSLLPFVSRDKGGSK